MPFRILSLDGGGIRGIVAAKMLATIEEKIGQPLHEYFDLIAGTSTGSILAAAIATGQRSEDIIEMYRTKSQIIFPYKSRFSLKRIPLILQYGPSAPKYSDAGFIKVLKEALGERKLFDITTPRLLILSFDTIDREAIVFKSWHKDKHQDRDTGKGYLDVPLWEVCLSSASAPTYFPAHKLEKRQFGIVRDGYAEVITLDEFSSSANDVYNNMEIRIVDGKGVGQTRTIKSYVGSTRQGKVSPPWDVIPDKTSKYSIKCVYSAIDGGVAANDPSSCAVAEALRLKYKPEDIYVLSIGTGARTRVISYEKARNWGLIQWAQPIIGILFDGSSEVYEYITNQVIEDRLLRLQFKLDRDLTGKKLSDDLDDVSEENIKNLLDAASAYMKLPKVQVGLEKFLRMSR